MTVTLTPQPQLRRLRSLPFWQKRFLRRAGGKEAKPRTSRTIYLLGSGGTIYDNDDIKEISNMLARPRAGTIYLLASVIIVFIISWLPLNLFNLLVDLDLTIFGWVLSTWQTIIVLAFFYLTDNDNYDYFFSSSGQTSATAVKDSQ